MKKYISLILVIYIFFTASGCQPQITKPILHYIPPVNSSFKVEFDYPGSWEIDDGPDHDSETIILDSVPTYKMGVMDYLTLKPSPTPVPDIQEVDISLVPDINNIASFKEQVIEFTKSKNGAPGVSDFKLESIILNGYPAYRESWIDLKTPLYDVKHDLYKEMIWVCFK